MTVVGYNVYRSEQDGGPYALVNAALIPDTDYIDQAIQRSLSYFYVARAVDSNGRESINSNQVVAVIPN